MSKQRQQAILAQLQTKQKVTGTDLANQYGVTRQVIVKDIALLRAAGYAIHSTPRGYFVPEQEQQHLFVLKSEHEPTFAMLALELVTIVEHGGTVIDVIIEHPIYHEMRIVLDLASVADVNAFIAQFQAVDAEPLATLTHGVHYHTISVADVAQEKIIVDHLQAVMKVELVNSLDK